MTKNHQVNWYHVKHHKTTEQDKEQTPCPKYPTAQSGSPQQLVGKGVDNAWVLAHWMAEHRERRGRHILLEE